MRTETFGPLNVRLTGGPDGKGGGDGPLVVLMHGFGAPGDDLVPLGQELRLDARVRFAFLEAPLTLELGYGDSRAWWLIDIAHRQRMLARGKAEELTREAPEGMASARTLVLATLEQLERKLGVPTSKMILGGFSQGSMLATDIVATSDKVFAGLVVLSGTLLNKDVWTAGLAKRKDFPVLQSHGRQDAILPYFLAEALRDLFKSSGMKCEFVEHAGGHEIPRGVLIAMKKFLTSYAV